jgi:alkylhydroperoxidase family enzyme
MDERLRATLGLLEKVTLSPGEILPADIATARAAGLTDRKILDATYVCVGFNIIARIADALGFDVPSEDLFARTAKLLVIFGYRRLSGFWTPGLYNRSGDLMLRMSSLVVKQPAFDPYDRKFRRLQKAVLSGPGSLAPAIRQTISEGRPLSGVLGTYAEKVSQHAYMVTDEDIAELHQADYTDDQIFEATVCAALGAGLLRLEQVLRAIRLAQAEGTVSADASLEESCTPSMIGAT